jgi:hypothetical protein
VTDPADQLPTAAECLAEAASLLREARKARNNQADPSWVVVAERCVDEAAVWARLAEMLMAAPSGNWSPQDVPGAMSVTAATAPPTAMSGYELRVAQLVRQGVPEDEAMIKEMPEPKGYACPVCSHLTGRHRMHGCDVKDCECVAPFGRVLPGDPAPSA